MSPTNNLNLNNWDSVCEDPVTALLGPFMFEQVSSGDTAGILL